MDDYDQDRLSRPRDPYGRRRASREELAGREPVRRRPEVPDQNETESPARPERTRRTPDPEVIEGRSRRSQVVDDQDTTQGRYSDRFRRQSRLREDDPDPRSYRSTRDPYDRLRRVGNRPPRRIETEYDQDFDFDQYDDDSAGLEPAASRRTRRPLSSRGPRADQQRLREFGSIIANPSPELRPLMMGAVIALGSLVLLSILILVRSDSAGTWIPLHLDAEGTPVSYGNEAALWRLPFFALVATVMAFGLGWWLRAREAYVVQFLVIGALLIHSLIWVGIINLLW